MLTNLRYSSFYVKLKKEDNKIRKLKSSSSRLKESRISLLRFHLQFSAKMSTT